MGRVTDPNTLSQLNGGGRAPSGGPGVFAAPPLAVRDTNAGIDNRNANTTNTKVDTATASARLPYEGGKARADALKGGAEAINAISASARGGMSAEAMAAALGRRATAQTLIRQLGDVEDTYQRDFRGGGVLQSAREYLPGAVSPTNQNFDTKATMMFPHILGLVPKTDSNPATYVQQKFEQYVPNSKSFDTANATRIGETRRMAQDVVKSTEAIAKSVDKNFLGAVSILVQNPSPQRRQQYDATAKRMGWASSALVLSGLNADAQKQGVLFQKGK